MEWFGRRVERLSGLGKSGLGGEGIGSNGPRLVRFFFGVGVKEGFDRC